MLVLVVLIVVLVAAWTFALWPRSRAARATPAPKPAPRTAAPHNAAPKPVEPLPRAESTEGLLVAQLVRGELTPEQYRKAMACLAERDESRHPLTLPGEN